ncbi:MAG TPA: type II toxin-antitoxin system VapC family toxin [Blastocatellia bacterium]|nr:type II toxin-antitoxin system VapC family toxin [Blastocatellia bacterium]
MKLLLDTHTFIWWANEPEKLSEKVAAACQDSSNMLILSVVSVWEMQIKMQLGKLKINRPIEELIKTQQQANSMQVLPVKLAHVLSLNNLPAHHKDPFDRLLIAQANIEGATLVSVDPAFSSYNVQLLW